MLSDGILKHFLYSLIILRLLCLSGLCLAGRFRLPCSKAGVLCSLFLFRTELFLLRPLFPALCYLCAFLLIG